MMSEITNRVEIPKTVFDKEYSTQWRREVKFLENTGINYVYAKKNPKFPIIRYKYTKTPELFLALAEFYNQVRIEQFFKNVEKTNEVIKEQTPLEKGCIELKQSDLTEAEKKTMSFQITEQDIDNVLNDDTE